MATRIAFVHTVSFLVETFRRLANEALPGIDCFHVLNESLLQDLLRSGASADVTRRVVGQIALAADTGVELVVVTCSSTSPAVDIARRLVRVPVVKIDDPMARRAVKSGSRIGLLCTAESTIGPSSELLRSHAQDLGRTITIDVVLKAEAFAALTMGDRAAHDSIMIEAARSLAPTSEVLVLAQASLAHLEAQMRESTRKLVLSSPPLLMQHLTERLLDR
jgi:Asp/Glu/hydantoin racemase